MGSRGTGDTMGDNASAQRARTGITAASRASASAAQVTNTRVERTLTSGVVATRDGRTLQAWRWDERAGVWNIVREHAASVRVRDMMRAPDYMYARTASRYVEQPTRKDDRNMDGGTRAYGSQTWGGPVRVSDPWDGVRTHARIALLPTDEWQRERVRVAHAARIIAEREAHGGTYVAHTCPRTPRERDDSGCRCIGGGGAKHRAHGWDTVRDDRSAVVRTCDARANVITDEHARTAHAVQRYLWDAAFDARIAARERV